MSEYCEHCGCPLDICCGERLKAEHEAVREKMEALYFEKEKLKEQMKHDLETWTAVQKNMVSVAELKKAIWELQGEDTWCVSWSADDLAGENPQNGEEFFKSKGEAEDFVEGLLVDYGEALEYEIERAKRFIDGEELLKKLALNQKNSQERGKE